MAEASFEVVVGEREHADGAGALGRLGPRGADSVEFVIAPNPGVPAGRLREIASGGELSRVMLALMSIATGAGGAPRSCSTRSTRASAETRPGRSGRGCAGWREHRQVVCITHLPQVASLAARHFRVVKRASTDAGVARADVERLDRSGLVAELCRMLGADCGRRGGQAACRTAARGSVESANRWLLKPGRPHPDLAVPAAAAPAIGRRSVTEIRGTARLGKRTKDLVKRLRPGDIAIIDHRDIDRMAAEDLVESGVQAVVNVAPSTTGRYPEPRAADLRGPACGSSTRPALRCSSSSTTAIVITLRGGSVIGPDGVVAEGQLWDSEQLALVAQRPAAADRRGDRGASPRTRSRTSARSASCSSGRLKLPPLDDRLPRPPRADRRARHRLQARPARDPPVRARPQAGARRRGRRRRRAARGGAEAGPDHRRHGLRLGPGAALRGRAGRARLRRRQGAGPRAARAARARLQGAARARHEPGRRDAGRVRARREPDRHRSARTST